MRKISSKSMIQNIKRKPTLSQMLHILHLIIPIIDKIRVKQWGIGGIMNHQIPTPHSINSFIRFHKISNKTTHSRYMSLRTCQIPFRHGIHMSSNQSLVGVTILWSYTSYQFNLVLWLEGIGPSSNGIPVFITNMHNSPHSYSDLQFCYNWKRR